VKYMMLLPCVLACSRMNVDEALRTVDAVSEASFFFPVITRSSTRDFLAHITSGIRFMTCLYSLMPSAGFFMKTRIGSDRMHSACGREKT